MLRTTLATLLLMAITLTLLIRPSGCSGKVTLAPADDRSSPRPAAAVLRGSREADDSAKVSGGYGWIRTTDPIIMSDVL